MIWLNPMVSMRITDLGALATERLADVKEVNSALKGKSDLRDE